MKTVNHLVKIEISTGGYEKTSAILVTDIPVEHAEKSFLYACILEANCDLEIIGDDQVSDGGYEFVYSPRKVEEIPQCDFEILSKYFIPFSFDLDAVNELLETANY